MFFLIVSGDVLTYFQRSDSSSCKTEAFLVFFSDKLRLCCDCTVGNHVPMKNCTVAT